MLSKKNIIISILVVFIFCIGFASASELELDNGQLSYSNIDDMQLSDVSEPVLESSDADSDLISNSADAQKIDAASDDSLQRSDEEILASTIKPSGKTFNDIQKAVNSAKKNDVIELNGSYTGSGKAINVKKSLTFNGVNGAALDAKKLSGIFDITANATVTFKNIKFSNAKQAAIYADIHYYLDDYVVNVTVDNCSFANNYNDYYGGAIYGKKIAVSNSNFTGNYVKDPEGEDSGIGSAFGGAIYGTMVNLTNCNFVNNNAQLYGGAVYSEFDLDAVNCTFKQNFAVSGGAIYTNNITVKGSIFLSNYLKMISSGYVYYLKGGAIRANGIISNCKFKNNSATLTGGKGGAVYGWNLDVRDSSFENNIANYAGAIYSSVEIDEDTYYATLLKIKDCTFISNNEAAVRAFKVTVTNGNSTKTFNNKTLDNNLKAISLFKGSAKKLITYYASGKNMQIKITTSPSNRPAKYLEILVTAESSKKTYVIPLRTNYKGIATLKASSLKPGYYKIYVHESFCMPGSDPGDETYEEVPGTLVSSSLKVNKAKTVVKAPSVKYKFKKSKYFKVTVKHMSTKKAISGLKIKLRVYTGKKYKTYTVKTNKKGVAKFNTKKLKRGKHKVRILSGNSNYIVSKSSYIRIR